MTLADSFLRFIGTKWFALVLGLVLMVVLPFTYHNFNVVLESELYSQFWFEIVVFLINVVSIGLCAYKFMALHHKPKPSISEEW